MGPTGLTGAVSTEETFTPPGPNEFDLPPIFGDGTFEFLGQAQTAGVTKPMVLVVLSAVIVLALFYSMSRKAAVVPGRLQFAGEAVYGFVRNSIARENIGGDQAQRYMPFLFGIFTFVLLNNYYGVIPVIQFPTMSRIGYVVAIALLAWIVYNVAGIAKHGFFGYLKHQTVPGGISGPILLMLVPLEFFSNIIVRPVTLTLRLFATMFAGHMLLLVFSLGGEFLVFEYSGVLGVIAGVVAWLLAVLITFLEMLIMFLQAYVFTLLTAMYIGLAVADEH
jgi:F-type H+-transporting ATPase subunit a